MFMKGTTGDFKGGDGERWHDFTRGGDQDPKCQATMKVQFRALLYWREVIWRGDIIQGGGGTGSTDTLPLTLV
jgi:hypothetical protein